jgi:alkylation response protein AidB-like acyl-CoA dehydrogenase
MTALVSDFRLARLPLAAQALRADVRAFLAQHLPAAAPAQRARSWMGVDVDFSRALAARGWVGLALPTPYGGAGLDVFARFVLVEELLAAGAPVGAHWIADRQSGPLILRYGTEAQRQRHLPRICAGQAFFCIGMSEPQAGSDLASVTTRATRTADGWRLSGQKLWTTHAQHCQHMIALVRTSGTAADRQRGLSQLIVDLDRPGVTVRPITDLAGDAHFAEVFFDDVALPHDALIGAEGEGWSQVTAELAFERSGPERLYSSIVLAEQWLTGLRRRADGGASQAVTVGRLASHLAALRQMALAVTAQLARGDSPAVAAALVKDLGTGFEQAIPALIAASVGDGDDDGDDAAHEALRHTLAYVSLVAPSYSLRGGTREILRGMIARGLGLR